jgi:hypothetical protein
MVSKFFAEGLELVVSGNEVGFAVDFNERGYFAIIRANLANDETFRCSAASLFAGSMQHPSVSGFRRPFQSRQVASTSALLAVHHGCARFLAEIFDHGRRILRPLYSSPCLSSQLLICGKFCFDFDCLIQLEINCLKKLGLHTKCIAFSFKSS